MPTMAHTMVVSENNTKSPPGSAGVVSLISTESCVDAWINLFSQAGGSSFIFQIGNGTGTHSSRR